jgi:membrane fusion protein, multidrug efflux system
MPDPIHSPIRRGPRARGALIIAAIIAALLVAQGLLSRRHAFAALQARSENAALLSVSTVKPGPGDRRGLLLLPGSLEAPNEASLYARSQGYLKRLHTDIGQHVRKGQLLAEIDTPELDEQLRQAQADLSTSRANEELARATAERWQALFEQKLVARQALEEKVADKRAKEAALEGQIANVARLTQMQDFRRVLAPFDGTITARTVDVGQLVTAAGGTPTSTAANAGALFRIASSGPLRIFVSVPQAQAALVKSGATAQLLIPERPESPYVARIVRTAGALDPATRSLRVELAVEDPHGELLPGAFAQVGFALNGAGSALRLPVSTLMFRGEGTLVAVVTAANKVALRPVKLGRDFGTEFEVVAGLAATDEVILSPPDSLLEGQPVQRAQPTMQARQPPPAAQPASAPAVPAAHQ